MSVVKTNLVFVLFLWVGFLFADEPVLDNMAPTAYLIDEDGKVGRLNGSKTTPHMFIIDRQGKLK